MSQRQEIHDESRSESQGNSSGSLRIIVVIITVLAIIGSVGSLVLPLVLPGGLASIRFGKSCEDYLKDKFDATRVQLQILQSLTDAASAKAAVPALREAVEKEIATNDALVKFLTENPPTEEEAGLLWPRVVTGLRGLTSAGSAIISAHLGMEESIDRAIRQELLILKPEFDRRSQSVTACHALISKHLSPKPINTMVPLVNPATGVPAPMPEFFQATLPPPVATDDPNTLPEIPLIDIPPWEPPADRAIRRLGAQPAHVRFVGVPYELSMKLSMALHEPIKGLKKTASGGDSYVFYASVAPIPDFDSYTQDIGSLGKVLEVNKDLRIITLWVSPATLRELRKQEESPVKPRSRPSR